MLLHAIRHSMGHYHHFGLLHDIAAMALPTALAFNTKLPSNCWVRKLELELSLGSQIGILK